MKITNKLGLPKPFISAVEREYVYTDKRYSVTQILKGYKEMLLERRHDNEIEQDVADMIWLIFGTAVHKILEDADEENDELKETKLEITMPNGYTLSGVQDLYSESLQRVTDYKTGSVYKVIMGDWTDYRNQLLAYAYMLRKIGFPVTNAENVMVLKDWSATKAKREADYPQDPVYIKHYDFADEDFEFIENLLNEKFRNIEELEKLPDDEIPECTPEERWNDPPKYAVMKQGRKSAVKLFDSEAAATDFLREAGSGHYLEERPGGNRKCESYCKACKFCNFYKNHYE